MLQISKTLIAIFFICLYVPFVHAAQLNKIAAVVNGQVITMFDLQKEALPDLIRARIDPANPAQKKAADDILRKILDRMIMDILVIQEAKRLNAKASASEIDQELVQMMKMRHLTKQQFESELAKNKLSIDDIRKNLEKSILRQKIMSMEVMRKVVVTPAEIKAYYEANKDKMYDRNGLHMGVMVYAPNINASAIAAQIKNRQISFNEACAKYSIAPNKEKGGDMGPIEWDRLNPEWEERLNKMRPGDVTEIFELQGRKAQVHLFRPGGGENKLLTLEEAKPQIDMILRQPKAKERFEDYTKQLKKKAVIDIRM